MVQFLLCTIPPGNPRNKVSPCDPGVGNFASSLVPGVGVGIIEVSSCARNYGAEIGVEPHRVSRLLCWGIPSICKQLVGGKQFVEVYKTCICKKPARGALKAKEARARNKNNGIDVS